MDAATDPRSDHGDATEVFRIDNVARVNGGMTFDITIAPVQGSTNLLTNGSFESGQAGRPDGVVGVDMDWRARRFRLAKSDSVDGRLQRGAAVVVRQRQGVDPDGVDGCRRLVRPLRITQGSGYQRRGDRLRAGHLDSIRGP